MIKSTLVKKKIGDKTYELNKPEIKTVHIEVPILPEFIKKVVTESNYKTKGEDLILVKNTDNCNLTLDSSNTDHIIIKALTNVTIIPSKGKIDEYYDEILKARRNSNNMLSPRDPKIRLVLVDSVFGVGSYAPTEWLELSRSKVQPR